MRLLLPLLLFGPLLLGSAQALAKEVRTFELPFWPTKGAEKDRRVVGTEWSGCGDVLIARVSVMPNPRRGDVLATDSAYELNSSSKVVRSWQLPANSEPVVVAGDRLLVRASTGSFLIGTRGDIEAVIGEAKPQPLPEVKCKLPRLFRSSGYASCVKLPSQDAGSSITLAIQGPCT
jgi:hypothetical protein